MQHCPARAAQRLAAAVLALCLVLALAIPHAHAAALQETHGIRMLEFNTSHILSIGNQTSGKCSWYALRYARTILDGKTCSGSGMWSNGAVWSAGGYYGYSGSLSECLQKLYTEKRDFFVEGLDSLGLAHTVPQGSYFIMVDIAKFLALPQFKGFSDLEFCEWVIRNVGVAAVPGSSFFREDVNNFVRLHFARSEETLNEALERLSRLPALV